jgi:aryl-alcohol dehydrogenase-like predicted oxidoreductase
MGYSTFDKGILTGRVDENRKFDEHDARSWAPWWKNQDKTQKVKIVHALRELLTKREFTLEQFALWFALQWKDFLDVALVGVRGPQQLQSLLKAFNTPISIGTIKEIVSDLHKSGFEPNEPS